MGVGPVCQTSLSTGPSQWELGPRHTEWSPIEKTTVDFVSVSSSIYHCFSRHITSRMVLTYYAQVCFGWLPFTENKGEGVANYIKQEGYLQM